ncbi:ankyrin repeat domain-containing protein 13B isoform X4 [Carassius carassius]|uniref:ankyrin repeat domain-containing protein 13B isoform X4 n=1 Tax=Carassius carassius TaxID=217509 RepID=UPI002868F707|nr:ankyrin repeat domain-containing protein 13B isoform X4 [Carassius carassius]
MMISARKTPEKSRYHLHFLVWHNKHRQLEKELSAREQVDLEVLDPRGRTPLHLAVTLGHLDCARLLVQHGADVSRENRNGWTVLQEAISSRNPEMVRLVLRYRDYQRTTKRLAGIPRLLERLRQAQDFYVEMKWEFTSWDSSAMVMEVDHDRQLVFCETLPCLSSSPTSPSTRPCTNTLRLLGALQPSDEQVAARLSAPVVATQLDTKNISFERNKTGILGWRSEKTEVVNGYEAKVYCASNVELITRTRTDHLTDQHKTKPKGGKTPLQSFLGIAEQHIGPNNGHTMVTQKSCPATNPLAVTAEEYFNPNMTQRDIGQPCHLTTKTQRFKAKLWLCESHPLSLSEQVAPIIDLMAISNALFAKLRDFITLRLPPGFPVKIEIPIYHILNARITFGNLNGCEEGGLPRVDAEGDGQKDSPRTETPSPGSDSSSVSSSSSTNSCRGGEIPSCVFEAPRGYSILGGNQRENIREEEDDLLQYAIQQSLIEAGSEYDQVTIWEALTNSKPGTHSLSCDPSRHERTPQHKPSPVESPRSTPTNKPPRSYDEQLRLAMALSAREQEEAELRQRREEEDLQRIIQLSLMEK